MTQMTLARQYFKKLGHGSIKQCAIKTGYTRMYINNVINKKIVCSKFTAQCMIDYTNGALTTNDFLIGKGHK